MKNTNNSEQGVTQSPNNANPAAIWARVSTSSQAETSLPSQVSRCKEKLEQAGYSIIQIFQVDWSSTDLFSCPQFQELCGLIKNREIEALAVFDRDRLEAKGLQRLIFLSECKEAVVELIICQGSPIIDGPEGQIVELALAIGKERAVLRARQGSKDGLYDRAVKFRKPVTYHKLFGYTWDKVNNRLVPDDDWPTVKLIFNMLLKGASYHPIIQELKKRGILSPSGQQEWNKTALSNIVHNPTYAGRYFALKKRAVEPTKRRGNGYGNSSCRKVPLNEAYYIPEIKIVDVPITWEQRSLIQDQLAQHQKLAQRNAKRDYLLRGLIFCETHRGKKGEPRRYHGQPHHGKSYRYTCPGGSQCSYPYLNGPNLDAWVKSLVKTLLWIDRSTYHGVIINRPNIEKTKQSLQDELHMLDNRYNKNINTEATLEDRSLLGQVHQEVYHRLKAKYRTERQWIYERQQAIECQLAQLVHQEEATASLDQLADKFFDRLDNQTNADWRQLLALLNLEIHVGKSNAPDYVPDSAWLLDRDIEDVIEDDTSARLLTDYGAVEIWIGLPFKPDAISSIVSFKPGLG